MSARKLARKLKKHRAAVSTDPLPAAARPSSMRTFFQRVVRAQIARSRLSHALQAYVCTLLVAAVTFYVLEESWSLVDSIYYSAMTAKTIGFGDITPKTTLAVLFNSVYAIASPGLTALVVAEFSRWQLRTLALTSARPRSSFSSLPARIFIIAVYLWLGSWLFVVVEGLSWIDSYGMCIAVLTTAGYGNTVPVTDVGKLLVVVYALAGNGIAALVIDGIGSAFFHIWIGDKHH